MPIKILDATNISIPSGANPALTPIAPVNNPGAFLIFDELSTVRAANKSGIDIDGGNEILGHYEAFHYFVSFNGTTGVATLEVMQKWVFLDGNIFTRADNERHAAPGHGSLFNYKGEITSGDGAYAGATGTVTMSGPFLNNFDHGLSLVGPFILKW